MSDSSPRLHHRLDMLLRFAFTVFAFSMPWSISASQISLEFSSLFFVLIIVVTRHNPFPKSLRLFYWAFVAWWLWLVIAALAGPTPGESLMNSREEWLTIAVPIGIYLFRDPQFMYRAVTALACGILLVSVQGFLQYFTGIDWLASQAPEPAPGFGYRVAGAFSGYVTFAGFMAVSAVALFGFVLRGGDRLSKLQRSLVWVAIGCAVLMTVLSFGRAALGALVVGLVVVAFILGGRSRLWTVVGVVVVIAGSLLMPGMRGWFSDAIEAEQIGYESGRRFVWDKSLEIVEDNPWFGVGRGQFRTEYESRVRSNLAEDKKVSHAHNDILHFAAVVGIPGAAIYVVLWVVVLSFFLRGVVRQRDGPSLAALGGSVCLLAMSMFHGVFVDAEIRALLMFLWAIGLTGWYKGGDHGAELSA
ncbi:hypothetical protein GF377_03080 [candidate division GN15 bacterium]|nr:hypothetical protein [candidate division GN15 bacterium]